MLVAVEHIPTETRVLLGLPNGGNSSKKGDKK